MKFLYDGGRSVVRTVIGDDYFDVFVCLCERAAQSCA